MGKNKVLNKLTIRGFKSIKELEAFELTNLNILIGANGAGKSNFVEIFRMLQAMTKQDFQNYILLNGGADDFLFNGPKVTERIEAEFEFGANAYSFGLQPTVDDRFVIQYEGQKYQLGEWRLDTTSRLESRLYDRREEPAWTNASLFGVGYYVYQAISNWMVYHFHDTSSSAPMRRYAIVQHNKKLEPDGANIAPFLKRLKTEHPQTYQAVLDAVRLVIPFFDDFLLELRLQGEKEDVNLSWLQKGSDYPMQPYHLSDGSIRFICLATALLQPSPPSTIVIDEPELGLHPYAIALLAELIQAAAEKTQIIISTQSPALVDYFEPDDVVVANRVNGASTFQRLQRAVLDEWLKDYSLGELWQKNVVLGWPVYE